MQVEPWRQSLQFVLCMFTGMGLGLLFDLFRILRAGRKTGVGATGVQDVLFFLLSALFFFWAMVKINDGSQRIYEWVAALFGCFAYMTFFSKTVRQVLSWCLKTMQSILRFCTRIFLFPLRMIAKIMRRPMITVIHPARILKRHLRSRYQALRKTKKKKKTIAKKIRKKV